MHLAQLNIARMLAPLDDPKMAYFTNNLERINALADDKEGFVWRLKGEEENARAMQVFEDNYLIINMSVWKNRETLFDFVYKTAHLEFIPVSYTHLTLPTICSV